MIVTLLKNEGMNSISLPEKIKGQYWIKDYNDEHMEEDLVSVEGINNQWMIKSNKNVQLLDNNRQIIKEMLLESYNLYCLYKKVANKFEYLFVEPITNDRKQFFKYVVNTQSDIRIGRSSENQIHFNNIVVSSTHARLVKENGKWVVYDENSTNGIYVNNCRVVDKLELNPGDVIFIMGLKIIIGNGFLAINNPDQKVTLDKTIFFPYIVQKMTSIEEDDGETDTEYFYRSPRFKRDVKEMTVKVDAPPANQQREEMPLMMAIGPSLTMGLASLTTGLFAINNAIQSGNVTSAIPSIVMSGSMLLGTVLWPVLTKRYEKKRMIQHESIRQCKYKNYLKDIEKDINEEAAKQKEIMQENYITVRQCEDTISKVKSSLWERAIGQDDFLKLRVGTGNVKAKIKYSYQERRFVLEDDNLQNEMLNLCENPKQLENAPIVVSLFENYISGVVGARKDTLAFAKGMLLQMLTYYSYDEFKIVLLIDSSELEEIDTIRWIPHVWNDEKQMRLIATNSSELKDVSAYMEQVIKRRMMLHEEERKECAPYYMILAFDRYLAIKAEMLKMLYQQKSNMNVGVITFFDEIKNLPKECTTVMELKGNSGKIFNKKDITGEKVSFVPDIYVHNDLSMWNMQLANLQLDILATAYNLPKMITFLEMYQVGKIEHLNVLNRWKENNPTQSLEVPVGVDTFGELFKLDLHEKYHGPHGLVAGMTGSGKSEFIMTYILSLALNYHPYEVAFILIDYKGGGMAKAFEKLPHTAGIITNLDGAAVNRSLASIQSELKRRQKIFVEVGNQIGESNIDIYKYQRLYREGVVQEPLQHLFIISDEFAELKTQQTEFMDQLISAARIGRSLGVHLILATQKPAGVVDDQIWSNSKFKICLKVQDRADSMDMLKRPDAAELSDTGRFYLQVGYNELFELGQSAWAGAAYYPSDQVLVEKDNAIEVIDNTGHVIKRAKPRRRTVINNPQKQLDAITEYLRQTAENEHIYVRPLWLEPIEAFIYIDAIEKKYATVAEKGILNPIIGEYDDPARQRQEVLRLPITTNGNVVVYGAAGMGKTTFLIATFYSLMKHHSPEELNIYILDFSSESLRVFQDAPHVGDVMVSGDDEKITNLFKMVAEQIRERKQLFSMYGGDIQSYRKESGNAIANIVIAINNVAAFIELYSQHEDDMIYLSREGTKYGIYFVITAINTNDVRYRVLQNFNQQFVLQLNDISDYASVLGNVNGVYPSKYKGRGIVKLDEVYEFQIGYMSDKGENVIEAIRKYCKNLKEKYGNGKINKIPVLPDVVDANTVADRIKEADCVPVGIGKESLNYVCLNMKEQTVSLALGLDMKSNLSVIKELVEVISQVKQAKVIILDPKSHFENCSLRDCTYYTSDIESHIVELFKLLVYRNNRYKEFDGKLPNEEKFEQVICILQDYSEIYNELSNDGKDKLKVLLEKNEPQYAVHFFISDEAGNMNIRTVEAWYKKHCIRGNGIWIGSGIADQYILKIANADRALRKEIVGNFGYVVNNGVPVLAKLISAGKGEGNNEQIDG